MHTSRLFSIRLLLLAAAIGLTTTSLRAADESNISAEKEKQLLATLRSDAPKAEKAITCKLLAIDGSSAAVADLAKLLPDPELSSWSRIALEAIPGPEAAEALRKATETLEGRLLVGCINSIGVRRDAQSVEALTKQLSAKEAAVASAAAVALGRIGNAEATKVLRANLAEAPKEVRSAVAEGCVLCAERLHAEGNPAEAIAIYDEVRKADVPLQRQIEGTRGAILARGEEGIPLLMEQFRSPNKAMFRLALGTVREFPAGEVDKALAAEMAKAPPERAALMITAMADRPKTVVIAAVVKAAESGPQSVRLAAINALGRVGDPSCVSTLLDAAAADNADLTQAAKAALAELPGDKVDEQIVALLGKADGKTYPMLIELVGQRRIDAVPQLLKAMDSSDKAVRTAALRALGETVRLQRLTVLVTQAVSPKHAEDAAVAQDALKAASVRMPDREACADVLAQALEGASATTKVTLLEILGEVGGTKALQTMGSAAKSKEPELQDAGSRILGKWNSVEAAPVLLDLAKTAPSEKYQVRALRGYIGLARKFAMEDADRALMCQNALAAGQTAEKKLVLDVLKLHPSVEGLKLAIKAGEVAELKDDATQATLIIAQKLGGKGVDVAQLLAAAKLDKVKLEIVKAQYGAGSTQKDVTAIIQKQAGDSPLITLPATGYNASFGGDPVPGSVKQLKVQYKMNGKQGEATFAEDALILLPMPK